MRKFRAIYLYLKRNTLIHDLVDKAVIKLNEQNQIDDTEVFRELHSRKHLYVLLYVQRMRIFLNKRPDECWKDRTLQDCYIEYVRSQENEKDLCYLTGNIEGIWYLHPKKIRNDGDTAKMISADDSKNFTYRGRFITKEEAFAVGNETSQKLHNALKWIIRKQGTFFDTLAIVSWESNQLSVPKWDADTDTIASEYEREQKEDEWAEEGSEEEIVSDTNAINVEKFL